MSNGIIGKKTPDHLMTNNYDLFNNVFVKIAANLDLC